MKPSPSCSKSVLAIFIFISSCSWNMTSAASSNDVNELKVTPSVENTSIINDKKTSFFLVNDDGKVIGTAHLGPNIEEQNKSNPREIINSPSNTLKPKSIDQTSQSSADCNNQSIQPITNIIPPPRDPLKLVSSTENTTCVLPTSLPSIKSEILKEVKTEKESEPAKLITIIPNERSSDNVSSNTPADKSSLSQIGTQIQDKLANSSMTDKAEIKNCTCIDPKVAENQGNTPITTTRIQEDNSSTSAIDKAASLTSGSPSDVTKGINNLIDSEKT